MEKTPLRVIVTRPAREAQDWAQRLQSEGFAAETLSLMGIEPLPAWKLSNQTSLPTDYAALFFVSSNAVAHFFKPKVAPGQQKTARAAIKNIANCDRLLALPTLRWMAPGPGTLAALRAAGVPADQIDAPPLDAAQFDSQTLWQQISQRPWRGAKVLVVCGESPDATGDNAAPATTGRGWLTQQWLSAGAEVDTLVVYRRLAPVLDAAQLQRARLAAQDGSVWLFSSAEAIACLEQQPGLADVDWQRARALATHPRIAAAARALRWGVVAMTRPALADVSRTLRSIESTGAFDYADS